MPEALPRVLIVTRNLPPLVGGMEQLNLHMAEQLADVAHVDIIGPEDSYVPASRRLELHGVPLRPLWKFMVKALHRALRVASKHRPEIVVAGSGLTAPIAWLVSRVCKSRAAVYLHGLDIAYRHPVYGMLWMPFIRRMDIVIANSSATKSLAMTRGVPEHRITLVHPGAAVAARVPSIDVVASQEFRNAHDLGDGPILLSVGRLTERKGMREFVRDVMPRVVAGHPDARLVVIGDTATDALVAKSQSRESIEAEATARGIRKNIHFLGVITDRQALSRAYLAASIHVFPVRELPGDPEGFGMVAIESAAHGLQTAAYATGGVVDAVADGVSGYLAPAGDAATLARHIDRMLSGPLDRTRMHEFATRFAWPAFGEAIRRCLLGDASMAAEGVPSKH